MTKYKRYQIDGDIYFTPREAEIARLILDHNTLKAAAEIMQLSQRTIEYYFNHMKEKLHCKKKKELIDIIKKIDFSKINKNR